MKRRLYILALALVCVLALAGCQCEHEWKDATCDTPKTCTLCDATEGAPLGHTWKAATCVAAKTCETCKTIEGKPLAHKWTEVSCAAPKTCSGCGKTEGEALPHTWTDATCDTPKTCSGCAATEGAPLGHTWQAATCEAAKTCQVCAAIDGEPLGHSWADATCTSPKTCGTCKATEGEALGHKWKDATTDAPKTCKVCQATEGSRIITDKRFTTAACKAVFGTWKSSETVTANDLGLTDESGSFTATTVYKFKNDGTLTVSIEVDDLEACKRLNIAGSIKTLCDYYGSREAADTAIRNSLNMSLEEYAKVYTEAALDELLSTKEDMVYFIKRDLLSIGSDWDGSFYGYEYRIEGDTLRLTDDYDDTTVFVRS